MKAETRKHYYDMVYGYGIWYYFNILIALKRYDISDARTSGWLRWEKNDLDNCHDDQKVY